jgi:hypothetical protein
LLEGQLESRDEQISKVGLLLDFSLADGKRLTFERGVVAEIAERFGWCG